MNVNLTPYVKANVLADCDVAAAKTLIGLVERKGDAVPDLLGTLLLCLALRGPRDRHTCIDLDHISDWLTPEGIKAQLEWPTDSATWLAATKTCPLMFGDPGAVTPLIVDGGRVYLSRSYAEEGAIAAVLTRNNAQHVHIILGGPGTGKTREVAMKFIDHFRKENVTSELHWRHQLVRPLLVCARCYCASVMKSRNYQKVKMLIGTQ